MSKKETAARGQMPSENEIRVILRANYAGENTRGLRLPNDAQRAGRKNGFSHGASIRMKTK